MRQGQGGAVASRDLRDVLAGLVLVGLGGSIAGYALQAYAIGTLGHIGPGMLPMATGLALLLLGVVIAGGALFRPRVGFERIDVRALAAVTVSGLVFAWLAPRFGMLPAVVGLVLTASLANRQGTLLHAIGLALCLAGISYLIFHLGLGVALPPLRLSL